MKKAIRYLRYSSDNQSNHSIAYQDNCTMAWCLKSDVQVLYTFIDEAKTGTNFNRPDFKRLEEYLQKFSNNIQYLVVDELSRFSRQTGAALEKIEYYQLTYNIQIVSASQMLTFDVNDAGSYMQAGINLLLPKVDNIIRRNKIKAGINAGQNKGRYFHTAPVGYKNTRDDKNQPIIIIDEPRAELVRNIYADYIAGTPQYLVLRNAVLNGLSISGNSSVERILTNPVYTGLIRVSSYRDEAEKMVQGIHEPIIDRSTWLQVQALLKGPGTDRKILNDNFPLRGVLHCHCGRMLTGAPSKGKKKYYDYYKCPAGSWHNNLSAIKVHEQFSQVLTHLSLPAGMINDFIEIYTEELRNLTKHSKQTLEQKQRDLTHATKRINRLEKLFIDEQVIPATYTRQYVELDNFIKRLNAEIKMLQGNCKSEIEMVNEALPMASDMNFVYNSLATQDKQQLINSVFDSRLYYRDGIYRTPYILPFLTHNLLKMKKKKLLTLDSTNEKVGRIPSGGAGGASIEHFLSILLKVKAA